MPEHKEQLEQLSKEFESCRKILLALGDENRQHLILEMMKMGECNGVRVGAVTEKTKNYYYFDADAQATNRLIHMLEHAKQFMEMLPDRSGEL